MDTDLKTNSDKLGSNIFNMGYLVLTCFGWEKIPPKADIKF